MFGLFSKKVRVTLVDDATGDDIAASDVPLEQLPDTFALDTELEFADQHFVVVRAEPRTKGEFARIRRLTITVRRAERVDPKTILYSLPTICGAALPATSDQPAPAGTVHLHEDDWRQCEYVAAALHESIAAELAGVRDILENATAKVGFRKIHVRERINEPLPHDITWAQVVERLASGDPIAGVAIGSQLVDHAVGVRLPDDVVVWGIESGGKLTVLCVEHLDSASHATVGALRRVAEELSLALVNWCRCDVTSRRAAPERRVE